MVSSSWQSEGLCCADMFASLHVQWIETQYQHRSVGERCFKYWHIQEGGAVYTHKPDSLSELGGCLFLCYLDISYKVCNAPLCCLVSIHIQQMFHLPHLFCTLQCCKHSLTARVTPLRHVCLTLSVIHTCTLFLTLLSTTRSVPESRLRAPWMTTSGDKYATGDTECDAGTVFTSNTCP